MQALVGLCFHQLCVSVADVQLHFEDGQEIQLACMVTISTSGKRVEPYSLQGLTDLVPLLNTPLTEVTVTEDGELVLLFGPTTLRCPRSAEYEPWNYSGLTSKVVAMPDGELAMWTDKKRG